MLTDREALKIAKLKLSRDIYIMECGKTDGIRAIYGDEAEWLCVLIYNAEENILRKEDEGK